MLLAESQPAARRDSSSILMLATLAIVVIFAMVMVAATESRIGSDRSAAGSGPLANGATSVDSVAVFGDSLTYQATDELVASFDEREIDGDVFGVTGIRVRDALHPIVEELEDEPDAVVVALGINDLLFSGDPWFVIKRDIDEMIGALEDVGCVIWVAPAMSTENAEVKVMSEYLHGLKNDRLHILDWGKAAMSEKGTYADDGVHHTDVGKKRFAAAIRKAVKDDCKI